MCLVSVNQSQPVPVGISVSDQLNNLNLSTQASRGKKARKITDYVWPNPLEFLDSRHTIDIGNGNKIYTAGPTKKLTLGEVTIEQYGYAGIEILNDMLRNSEIASSDITHYLVYVQSVFRLASNIIWPSVLLYDMEYRDHQARDNFQWGSFIPNLREFHLVQKPDSVTAKAIGRNSNSFKESTSNSGNHNNGKKGKGPFLPDGRTICRRFNTGECYRQDCKLAHHCAICYGKTHNASQHSASYQYRQSARASNQQSQLSES